MYDLYITNKNYSSWSLRAWVLMKELEIPFEEHLVQLGLEMQWEAYRKISPTGKVPCLVDRETVVWDSLAIVEYLGELHNCVWPADRIARAWARSAAAEMHSGFSQVRSGWPMSCGVRVRLNEMPLAREKDIDRIGALWNEGLRRFGGPFLAGKVFTAVDAFFAPVAFRIQTYGLSLDPVAASYARWLLDRASMRQWYSEGLKEKFRDEPHDADVTEVGTVIEDLREK
jgi:glutathione S-transferase